jgi:predicted amidohydrolase
MRISACQTPEILGDVTAALDYMTSAAAQTDADLMLFPEAFLQGYLAQPDHVARYALADLTPVLRRLIRVRPVLVFGVLERRGDEFFNSAVVVKGGRLLGVYRKTHLYGSELTVFTPGSSYPVFTVDGVRFGINICYDTRFPQAAAAVADQGAQLLLVPRQNMMPRERAEQWRDRHNDYSRERVRETGMWLVSADVTGVRDGDRIGLGPTCAIDPSGAIVAQVPLGSPGMVTVQIPASSTFSNPIA